MSDGNQRSDLKTNQKTFNDNVFQKRLDERKDVLFQKYMNLYHDEEKYNQLIDMIFKCYNERSKELKKLDEERLNDPGWYHKNDMIYYLIYVENFAGTLKGIESKLDYLEKLKVKVIHLMPILDAPKGKNDGGFAVSDFKKIRSNLGTIDDLKSLIREVHKRKMSLMMEYVVNLTSDEHKWAKKAKENQEEYQKRYHFYDNWTIPNEYEASIGKFFLNSKGSFKWVPECGKIVMTMFNDYQWDLNYSNPVVFNKIVLKILYFANVGFDILSMSGINSLWKKKNIIF